VELQSQYEVLQKTGAEVVAVAVASAVDVESWQQGAHTTFPVLADPGHHVADSYGVYNLLGNGFATPAAFVIDPDGHIVWSHIGQHTSDRPNLQTILKQLKDL
jgi:peroxiredoxin